METTKRTVLAMLASLFLMGAAVTVAATDATTAQLCTDEADPITGECDPPSPATLHPECVGDTACIAAAMTY